MPVSLSYEFASKSLPPKPTGYGLAIVATLLLCGAIYLGVSIHDFETDASRTTGVVTSLQRSDTSYFPVFEFTDSAGRTLEVRSSSSSKKYLPGDEIPILYDPERPLDARIHDATSLYVLPVILLILSVAFYAGAVLMLKLLPFFEAAYDRDRAAKEAAEKA